METVNTMIRESRQLASDKWQVGWGITKQCNMECRFCYSATSRRDSKNVSAETLFAFIDNNHSLIDAINYGTGENTLISSWYDLIHYIRTTYPTIGQALTTNGHVAKKVYSDPHIWKIVRDSIDEIDVSLDFADAEKHNQIRGHQEAFSWAMNTLQFCADEKIKSTIVMIGLEETLTKSNLEGIFAIAAKYGAMVRINIYRPSNKEVNLTPPKPSTVYTILGWLMDTYAVAVLSDPLFSSIFYAEGAVDDKSGSNSLRILPDGSITPSTYLVTENWRAGHISEAGILKKIKKSQQFKTICEEIIPDTCSDCALKNRCKGGAKDRRILYYGTLQEADPYCPFRKDAQIDLSQIKKVSTPRSEGRVSIHDGYLPTLIFQNASNHKD